MFQHHRAISTGRSRRTGRYADDVPSYRSFAIFVLALVVLKRFFGLPISIGGSILLTLAVSAAVTALESRSHTRRGAGEDRPQRRG